MSSDEGARRGAAEESGRDSKIDKACSLHKGLHYTADCQEGESTAYSLAHRNFHRVLFKHRPNLSIPRQEGHEHLLLITIRDQAPYSIVTLYFPEARMVLYLKTTHAIQTMNEDEQFC